MATLGTEPGSLGNDHEGGPQAGKMPAIVTTVAHESPLRVVGVSALLARQVVFVFSGSGQFDFNLYKKCLVLSKTPNNVV